MDVDNLLGFLFAYRAVIGAIALAIFLVWVILNWWLEVRLFLKSIWYRLPVVGKTARLSKDISHDNSGWFRAETALCADFASDLRAIAGEPDLYDKAKSYLNKVQELGRNKLNLFGWILIVLIVFVEALGFSYVLAGWTLPGASEALQVQGAFGIAFLIAVILVALTHLAGHEMHKRGLVRKARVWWLNDKSDDKPTPLGSATGRVSLEHDYEDENEKNYVQILNRVDHNAMATPGFPWIGLAAIIVIVSVAVGATYVRIQTQEQILMEESTLNGETRNGFGFPGLTQTPRELAQPQQEAQNDLFQDIADTKRRGGRVTFAVLATIFIFIQILGIIIGFKTGFAGKESNTARRIIGNFKSRREYEAWFARKLAHVSRIAQGHLTRLQSKLQERAADFGVDKQESEILRSSADRSFKAYVDNEHSEEQVREAERRDTDEKDYERSRSTTERRRATETRAKQDLSSKSETGENAEMMERRIREELENESANSGSGEAASETEDEMRARIRSELSGENRSKKQGSDK